MGGNKRAMARFSVGADRPACTASLDGAPDDEAFDGEESESNPADGDEPDPDDLGHRIDPITPLPLQVIGLGGVVGAVVVGGAVVGGAVVGVVVVGLEAPGISESPCCSMAAGLWVAADAEIGVPPGMALRMLGTWSMMGSKNPELGLPQVARVANWVGERPAAWLALSRRHTPARRSRTRPAA
jgi:hypothetical protein